MFEGFEGYEGYGWVVGNAGSAAAAMVQWQADLIAAISGTDSAVMQAVATEAARAVAAEANLQSQVSNLLVEGTIPAVQTERAERIGADGAEAGTRSAADIALSGRVDAEQVSRLAGDAAEASARSTADGLLDGRLDTIETAGYITVGPLTAEASARQAADALEAATRADADTAEIAARDAAISTHAGLKRGVHGIPSTVSAGQAIVGDGSGGFSAVDVATQAEQDAAIASEVSSRNSAIGSAVAAHESDTTNVHGIADTSALATAASVASAVAAEASRATTAEGTNATAITTEATARASADSAEVTARNSAISSAVSTHEADTTNVHGIADTSALATNAGVASAVGAEASRASIAEALLVPLAQKGAASGVASLGTDGRVPAAQSLIGAINARDVTYGVTANGTTDDLAALVSANAAAATAGKPLYLPAGTYMVSDRWTPSVSIYAEPGATGATIKKTAAFPTSKAAIRINGTANVEIHNLKVDGNRAAGALGRGIDWTGAGATGGKLVNCWITQNISVGVQVDTSAELACYSTRSTFNVSGTGIVSGSADGFYCTSSGVLKLHDCTADDNDRAGAHIDTTAGDGCHIDLRASRNLRSGAFIKNSHGTIKNLSGDLNSKFGLEVGANASATGSTGWDVGRVSFSNVGKAFTNAAGSVVSNVSGTAVEMYAATGWDIGVVIARDCQGYSVAMTQESGTGVGCVGNKIGTLLSDQTNAVDGDPAIHISGASSFNAVAHAVVRGNTFAASYGEGVAGAPTDNVIGTLFAEKCTYGVWKCEKVSGGAPANNRIDRVISRDTYNSSGTYPAQFCFLGSGVTGNVVGSYTHRTVDNPAPTATISQTTSAAGNSVEATSTRRTSQERNQTQPTAAIAENFPRDVSVLNLGAALATGVTTVAGVVTVPAGQAVASASISSGTTPLSGTTHLWAALVRVSDRKVLAVTTDDTSGTWGANTLKTFTFTAAWTADVDTACYVAIMASGTPPSLLGHDWNSVQASVKSVVPLLAATCAATSEPSPPAIGDTIGALTTSRLQFWTYVS